MNQLVRTRFVGAWLLLVLVASPLAAEVKLPALFSDHMVLQQQADVPVWGWAAPNEKVSVEIAGQRRSATADAAGKWMVRLKDLKPGGPHTLTVQGANKLVVGDVLVGEVWLGSGQSNMAMTVNRAKDFQKEQSAATHPEIRMFTVTSGPASEPQQDCTGSWAVCSPETVARFSATAYFFGRELHRELKTPVGLINSSVGGTPIESWIRLEAQKNDPKLKPFFAMQQRAEARFDAEAATKKYERDLARWQEAVKQARAEKKPLPRKPQNGVEVRKRKGDIGGLYNGKIAPLAPYAIRGALWYQGEANSTPDKAPFYDEQLALLVTDWRHEWGQGDFPFAWVQLPNFGGPGRDWPVVREAMLKTLRLPNTGMAITIDIGDAKDIHPTNKQDVGKRLAMWALGSVYDRDVATSGPLVKNYEIRGNAVIVTFKHSDGGLVARSGHLAGFEVADSEGNWHAATANIDGNQVVIASKDVEKPSAARYAWENNPKATLFNGAGLPASPFRTRE
jgi:sialate O-acetylesterase